MQSKVLLAYQSRQRESRKGFGEELKGLFGVLCFAFAFEAVNPIHVVCLVISAIQEERFRI